VRYYTRESGVRNLEREIAKIARKVVKELALAGPAKAQKKGKAPGAVTVTSKNLDKYLGVQRFDFGASRPSTKSAWSPAWPGPKSAATCCRSRPA
jgi:ATP-dependent Lon protease